MAHMIHVLLVEYDNKIHDEIKNMLQYFSYKVSTSKLASTALSMLSKQKDEYDIVMVNMNSPDSYGLQLLQYAVQMDLLVIYDDDAVAITRALEQGAFLCAKKPITMETIGYLWQHALREKAYRLREREQPRGGIEYNAPYKEFEEDLIEGNLKSNKNTAEKCKSKKNVNLGNSQRDNVMFRKKVWTEWTQELHEKFMNAIIQLGEGRCYPKDILELMNVPGLTRMQVASHLQKCRNAKWQPPNERKSKPANSDTMLSKSKGSRTKLMRFGSMPHLESSHFHLKIQENHENYREFTTNSRSQTNANENNPIGSAQKRYHLQLLDHGNYLFAQGNETFNMGQPRRTFGMDETFMFGAQSATPSINSSSSKRGITEDVFEFQNMDTGVQNFNALQQELGLNYNENMQAHVSNLYYDQISTATNGTNQWSHEIPKSVINKESKD